MRPQQQVAAVLDILLDAGGCVAGGVREVPDVVGIAGLDVAQPEEHAVVFDVLDGADAAEIEVFALGIVLVEPEPCGGFVVVAVGNELFGGGILREEGGELAANLGGAGDGERAALVVLGDEGGFPAFLHDNVLEQEGGALDGLADDAGAVAIDHLQDVGGGVLAGLPGDLQVVLVVVDVDLLKLKFAGRGSTGTGEGCHDAIGEGIGIGILEEEFVELVGLEVPEGERVAGTGGECLLLGAVLEDGDLHDGSLGTGGPGEGVVVVVLAGEGSHDTGHVGLGELHLA